MTVPSGTEALIWALSTRLIAGATATQSLLAWCEEHGLSDGPITVDVRQRFSPASSPTTFCRLSASIPAKPFTTGRFG